MTLRVTTQNWVNSLRCTSLYFFRFFATLQGATADGCVGGTQHGGRCAGLALESSAGGARGRTTKTARGKRWVHGFNVVALLSLISLHLFREEEGNEEAEGGRLGWNDWQVCHG